MSSKGFLFHVKESSYDDDNPEFKIVGSYENSKSITVSDTELSSDAPKSSLFVHSEVLAKKIYHHGIPIDLKGLALWSAKTFASEKHVMIDVGSHLGIYSMAFQEAGAGAVYSFECNPAVYTALVNNVHMGGTTETQCRESLKGREKTPVKTFPFALGDRNESNVGFHNRTQDGNENGFHMYSHEKKFMMFHHDKPKDSKLHLDMVKFDSLWSGALEVAPQTIKQLGRAQSSQSETPFKLPLKVNFVKVNVNGFEKQVFQGMEMMLTRDFPTLMFGSSDLGSDLSPSQSSTFGALKEELQVLRKELFTYLESLGYKIMKIQGSERNSGSIGTFGLNHFIAKKIN
jgi:FkbM family methyltransferase